MLITLSVLAMNRLSMQERLELFAQVCNAIQRAHQKGIIHRDLNA